MIATWLWADPEFRAEWFWSAHFRFVKRLYTKIWIKIWDKNVEIPPQLWAAAAKKSDK